MTITLCPTVLISGLGVAPETEMMKVLRLPDAQSLLREEFRRALEIRCEVATPRRSPCEVRR
jgi:hypothetical protein